MFAIVKSGGKQYRVEKDHTIAVERLSGEVGAQVELRDVLLLGAGGAQGKTVAGEPVIAEACVRAEIVRQDRLPKIIVFKKKRRKNYRRTRGHRQHMTWLRIDGIEAPKGLFPAPARQAGEAAGKAAPAAKKAAAKPAARKTAAKKAPAKKAAAKKAAAKKTAAKKTPAKRS